MPEQSYSNHSQRVPAFIACAFALLLAFIAAVYMAIHGIHRSERLHDSIIGAVTAFAALFGMFMCRGFALKVQDRAIRAEENLRHYVLTGKLLDKRLTVKQIVAVRFASDDQFPDLAREAAEKGMAPDDIKQAVKTWRADFDRA